MSEGLTVIPLLGIEEINEGDDLGAVVAAAAGPLVGSEVVVISHKVVSKAEGRVRDLASVEPGDEALALAAEQDKDPRLVQLILNESARIVRAERGVLITETHSGWICANAGIDASNVPGEDAVVLLPVDADGSARRIRSEIREAAGASPAVVIADSFGRAWRVGQVDVAIGCAGLVAVDDWRGRRDAEGGELTATVVAVADEVAAAADLVRDKDSGVPAALVRGLGRYVSEGDGPGAAALRRAALEDLFR